MAAVPVGTAADTELRIACALTEKGNAMNNNETIHGIQPSFMDRSADPGVDFNRFANGAWIDAAVIPPEYSRWGTFNILRDKALADLHAILLAASADTTAKPGSIEQQVGDFFFSGMNEAKIEADGVQPLAPEFDRISRVRTVPQLIKCLAHLHKMGVGGLFGFGAMGDLNDSSTNIAHIVQGGTALPDRDYYLNNKKKDRELKQKYVAHVAAMFQLLGESSATAYKHAHQILAIETKLARAQMSRVERRDANNINNKTTVADFQKTVPNLPVKLYFSELGAPEFTTLNVHQPKFFVALSKLLAAVPMAQWRAYLRWNLIRATADELSSPFVNESFNFFGRTLSGSQELQPRWKRIVEAVNGSLGECLAQLYVKKHFPPEAKAKMMAYIDKLLAALRETLEKLPTMGEETRKNALRKLSTFEANIGYPDKWDDYSALHIDRGSFVLNVLRCSEFAERENLSRIGKPVDKTEWSMLPQTVNAQYAPMKNKITFPAAILQPPFFDPFADDASNYGGIVVVIGHEVTHGFDDSGARYDELGNLKNWWTEEDLKLFRKQIDLIIEQFSGFTVVGGEHVNGKLVVGEAAADLGGLKLAYRALQKTLAETGRKTDANGFTDEQRFFIAFAQLWAIKIRDEAAVLQVKTDPHPPAQFRVNGTLAHVPEFAQAFGLSADCPIMLPAAKQAQLW